MFACGTSLTVAPVHTAFYKNLNIVPIKYKGELSAELYKRLQDIQVRVSFCSIPK